MILATELKMGFQKLKPHTVAYRDYKHFDNEKFQSDIQSCASENIWNALKKLLFAFLTSILLLKESNEAPSWQKSYI